MRRQAVFIAGKRHETGTFDRIASPYDGTVVSEVALCAPEDVDVAVASAFAARASMRRLPVHVRAKLCDDVAARLTRERETLARLITEESGKPIRYARGEVDRAITTFTLAGSVARTLGGELLPADVSPSGVGK